MVQGMDSKKRSDWYYFVCRPAEGIVQDACGQVPDSLKVPEPGDFQIPPRSIPLVDTVIVAMGRAQFLGSIPWVTRWVTPCTAWRRS
jgi:hypothetical protein